MFITVHAQMYADKHLYYYFSIYNYLYASFMHLGHAFPILFPHLTKYDIMYGLFHNNCVVLFVVTEISLYSSSEWNPDTCIKWYTHSHEPLNNFTFSGIAYKEYIIR